MKAADFTAIAANIAEKYKTLYVMGCFGAPLNAANKQRYKEQYEYNRRPERAAMIDAASADTFGFDCICFIKAILWGWNGDTSKIYGGAVYASNGVPDIGTNEIIKVCRNVSADFRGIKPGEVVWLDGHIGIYAGNGLAVESSPAFANRTQFTTLGNLSASPIGGYPVRSWTTHGELPYVDYSAEPAEPPSAGFDLPDAWARGAYSRLTALGIVAGNESGDPMAHKALTRQEAFVMLDKLYSQLKG
ncbi:MAG: hypothetical protein LBN97_07440 [Oscillospiraceae bacterium]|nr:hypothetical protein [Oscillospiraceae bacterium]